MNPKKHLLSDGEDTWFVKRLRQGKYSNVIVRVHQKQLPFSLLSLVTLSTYFRNYIEPMFKEIADGDNLEGERSGPESHLVINVPYFPYSLDIYMYKGEGGSLESGLVIDLPNFPYSLGIFEIVQRFCSDQMEENDISTENAVKLFSAAEFLGMDALKCRVSNFLEDKAFNSVERCLTLLSTFDCLDLPSLDKQGGLFEKCKNAFLCKIRVQLSALKQRAVAYNLDSLVHVSSHMAKCVAERIHQSFKAQLYGFDFVIFFEGLAFYNSEKVIEESVICSAFFIHLAGDDALDVHPRLSNHYLGGINTTAFERWVPPGGSKEWTPEDLLLEVGSHRDKLMTLRTCIKDPKHSIIGSSELHLSFVCGHLVYPSELYCYDVFEDVSRRKEISSQHELEITKLLDSNVAELAENNSKKLLEECHLDFAPQYVKRFLAMQQHAEMLKSQNQNLTLELDESLRRLQKMELSKNLGKAQSDKELGNLQHKLHMQNEKLISIIESKRLVESEKDALKEQKRLVDSQQEKIRHDLEEEKEKTVCQICLTRPRDALCLPCMHFLYCSECLDRHQLRTKNCPICRCVSRGVLKCNFSV